MTKYLPKLEIIVPVLMPSRYLESMRESLKDIGESCRVNYVLDFATLGVDQEEISRIKLSPSERLFSGQFGSPGKARNRALQECEGKYLCFWDVDDKPEAREVLEFTKELESQSVDVGIGSWTFTESPNKKIGTSPISLANSPGIWRIVFKLELVKNMRFTDLQWGEDQLFLIEALSKNPKIVTTSEVIYRYDKNSINSQTSKMQFAYDLPEATKLALAHVNKAQGVIRASLTLMLCKQLITVFKFTSLRDALSNVMLVLFSSKDALLRNEPFSIISVWKNKW